MRQVNASRNDKLAVIVLAAGRGTRMRSARPKLVHALAGRALIEYPLRAAAVLGARPVVVVIGHGAEAVRAACDGYAARFAVQAEQRGTGHAALCAVPRLGRFDGAVVLVNGDLPLLSAATLRGLVDTHRAAGGGLALLTARLPRPDGYGRIVRADGRVVRIVEQKDATAAELGIDEVNVGVYCVGAAFLRATLPLLRPDNAQGELYLTDIVARAIAAGMRVADAPAPPAEVAQVNWRGELAAMEKVMRERINRRWMEAGVTLEDPDTAYIDADVEIGPDTVIGPNVQLRGRTRVGARCRFDGSALVRDARIGDDTHIKFGVVVADAEIGAQCEVGPFAQIRAGTHLAERVVIGDFVETKEARLAAGAKARHLTYLGDVEVGADTNVGAGTITCNYDGFRKHRTTIGSRVMIGSDTQLVAPVTVGDDAYVASGTTVMKDVPPGALSYNVKTQRSREGWVAARRGREAGRKAPAKQSTPRPQPAPAARRKAGARGKKARSRA